MARFSLPLNFDARRVRSYVFRIPLCTRFVLAVATAFLVADVAITWFGQWATLIPQEVHLTSSTWTKAVFRINLT